MKSYEIQADIEKLAKARRCAIDGMLARDIAEYIIEQLDKQRAEIEDTAQEDSDTAADMIADAAGEFLNRQADIDGEY